MGDEPLQKPIMTEDVAEIAARLIVRINGEPWQATLISLDRFEKNGPQWVRLEVLCDDKAFAYYIDRKLMVKSWLALEKGQSVVDGMTTFVNGVQWTPVRTEDLYVEGVRSVLLVLRSPDGVDQHITIDRDGLIKAYYGLRTDIQDLIGDVGDVLQAMYQLSSQ